MNPVNDTNDINRADYNRKVAKAAEKAARWAMDAGENDHYDIEEAAGEAMDEVWGEEYRTHRGKILDFAARLPDDFSHIHDHFGPDSTVELLDLVAREALKEDIYSLAWKFEEFGHEVREREHELDAECVEA